MKTITTTVVFDLDDTLYPEKDFVISGFMAVDEWVCAHLGIKGFFQQAQEAFEQGIRGTIFNTVLDKLAANRYNQLTINEMIKIYRNHFPKIQLATDAEEILKNLKGKKNLAIITDGDLSTQKNKGKALDLENKIDLVVYTDAYGRENWKPSKLPYEKVMDHFHVKGSECVYIGDNPSKDFKGANELGWLTVRLRRPQSLHRLIEAPSPEFAPKLEINSLSLVDWGNCFWSPKSVPPPPLRKRGNCAKGNF